jgi:Protein of unknown function (DUF1236)
MRYSWLLTGGAVALLCAGPAIAQTQQKEEKAAPAQTQSEPSQGSKKQVQPKDQGSAQHGSGTAQGKAESTEKGTKSTAQPKQMEKSTKGTAQGETPERPGKAKGMTQKGADEGKTPQGTAQTPPNDQGTKGTAETHPRDQGTKGATSKEGTKGTAQTPSREQGTKGTATNTGKGQEAAPKSSETAKAPSGGGHMQLSEEQRTNVHGTILKERNVNRATNVNFTIDVGTRVPRHVHLAPLPNSVISIVPHYRNYRYFVAGEEICIVEPTTYEIVEVIRAPGRTIARVENRGAARLALTDNERMIILQEVGASGGSTLGLGALTEGAEVPRGVELRSFPETVVEQVPKVTNYRYFTAENRVAIVDPQSDKIQLVIEGRR